MCVWYLNWQIFRKNEIKMHLCAVAAAGGNGKGRRQCLWDKLEATAAPPRPPTLSPPPSRPPTLSPPQPRLLGCCRSIGCRARRRAGEAEEAAQDSQLFCLKVQSHRRAAPSAPPPSGTPRPLPQCAAPTSSRRLSEKERHMERRQ